MAGFTHDFTAPATNCIAGCRVDCQKLFAFVFTLLFVLSFALIPLSTQIIGAAITRI
jgi:hypothetical protein